MNILSVAKANIELGKLKEQLEAVTKDNTANIAKLAEYEKTHKEYMESAQTAEAMKADHAKALEAIKVDYEAKLAELKESHAKEISTVKNEVAKETIAIVASQGTNAAIETVLPVSAAYEETKNDKVKYQVIPFKKQ